MWQLCHGGNECGDVCSAASQELRDEAPSHTSLLIASIWSQKGLVFLSRRHCPWVGGTLRRSVQRYNLEEDAKKECVCVWVLVSAMYVAVCKWRRGKTGLACLGAPSETGGACLHQLCPTPARAQLWSSPSDKLPDLGPRGIGCYRLLQTISESLPRGNPSHRPVEASRACIQISL